MRSEAWMVLGGIGASFITALTGVVLAVMNRPKVSADAKAANATGETTVSADARAWAEDFREEMREAKADATTARAAAVAATQRANEAEDRLDVLEEQQQQLAEFVGVLVQMIVDLNGHPPEPPPSLIPPLKRP